MYQVIVVAVRDDHGVEVIRELGDVARRWPVPPRTHVLARTGARAVGINTGNQTMKLVSLVKGFENKVRYAPTYCSLNSKSGKPYATRSD